MMSTQTDRRRRDLRGRLARATWPARESAKDWIGAFPCNLIGHHWQQIPPELTSARARATGRMRFKCTRCFLVGGFSN